MGEVRRIGDRHPEHLQPSIAVFNSLGVRIVDDLHRFDLPQRRSRRIGLAQLARRIDTLAHLGDDAGGASGAGGGDARAVGHDDADRLDGGIAQIAGDFHAVAENPLTTGLGQRDVAGRRNNVGLLVVGDGVGAQPALPVNDLDVAAGGDQTLFLVVAHLVGAELHRQAGIDFCLAVARSGPRCKLKGCWVMKIEDDADDETEADAATVADAAPAPARQPASPNHRRLGTKACRAAYQAPVRRPTAALARRRGLGPRQAQGCDAARAPAAAPAAARQRARAPASAADTGPDTKAYRADGWDRRCRRSLRTPPVRRRRRPTRCRWQSSVPGSGASSVSRPRGAAASPGRAEWRLPTASTPPASPGCCPKGRARTRCRKRNRGRTRSTRRRQ